jgi:two-component system LytT family response regulator
MKAFDAAAVDYLLKPFDEERFRTALERARRRVREHTPSPNASELKQSSQEPGRYTSRIVVKDGTRIHLIPVKDLDYAEAQDDYVALHCGGKTYLKQQTISALESSLDPEFFVRTHRSYIVNLERVTKIEPYTKDTRIAVLPGGAQIPVSRAGFLRLKELMSRH